MTFELTAARVTIEDREYLVVAVTPEHVATPETAVATCSNLSVLLAGHPFVLAVTERSRVTRILGAPRILNWIEEHRPILDFRLMPVIETDS